MTTHPSLDNAEDEELETNAPAYNTSLPAWKLLEEGLEGLLNKSKGWKITLRLCSLIFFLANP